MPTLRELAALAEPGLEEPPVILKADNSQGKVYQVSVRGQFGQIRNLLKVSGQKVEKDPFVI